MAVHEGVTKVEMRKKLSQWQYDYRTATYLLLLQKKMRGKPIRLVAKLTTARPLFESPQPRERSKSVDMDLESFANSPVFFSVKQKAPSRFDHFEDKENFVIPPPSSVTKKARSKTRVVTGTPRNANKSLHSKPSSPPMSKLIQNSDPSTPRKEFDHRNPQTPVHGFNITAQQTMSPSRSYDSALNNLKELERQNTPVSEKTKSVDAQLNEAHNDNSALTPFSAKRKSRKLGGSFEKMINLLTPRKHKGSREEPKKTKAQHNISVTSKFSADEVLEQIKKTIVAKQLNFVQYGWTLRVMMTDDWGKLHLAFDLEICQQAKNGAMAVRRKRIKGDSWHYKKYCEDILRRSGF